MARRPIPDRLELPEGQIWFSLSEVARALNRHKLTVYRWEKNPEFPKPVRLKRGNKERRYSREQVEQIWRWMTETVDPSASPEPAAMPQLGV